MLYNNIIASALYPVFALATGELEDVGKSVGELTNDSQAAMSVLASCAFAVSISYFGLNARKMLQVSALR